MLAAAVAVTALIVVATATGAQRRPRTVRCRNQANATKVRASGVSCGAAADAIVTYEGAPVGCVTSSRCLQSGTYGLRGTTMIVACRRRHLDVTCSVYLRTPRGDIRNPKVDGIRLNGRWSSGTVSLVMKHDPYGCPANPACHP